MLKKIIYIFSTIVMAYVLFVGFVLSSFAQEQTLDDPVLSTGETEVVNEIQPDNEVSKEKLDILQSSYDKARVLESTEVSSSEKIGSSQAYEMSLSEKLRLEFISGNREGETIEIENSRESNPGFFKVRKGDVVIVRTDTYSDLSEQLVIYNYDRSTRLVVFVILIAISVLIFSGLYGLRSLISMGVVIAITKFWIIDAYINNEFNYFWLIIVLIICIASVIGARFGYSRKAFAAFFSAVTSVILTFIVMLIVNNVFNLSGFLAYYPPVLGQQYSVLNYRVLFMTAVLLGVSGLISYISLQLVDYISNVRKNEPSIRSSELFARGILHGKQVLTGGMHVMLFVYISMIFPLFIVYSASTDYLAFVNAPDIAHELIRLLVAFFGIFVSIPLSVFFATIIEQPGRGEDQDAHSQKQFEFKK